MSGWWILPAVFGGSLIWVALYRMTPELVTLLIFAITLAAAVAVIIALLRN